MLRSEASAAMAGIAAMSRICHGSKQDAWRMLPLVNVNRKVSLRSNLDLGDLCDRYVLEICWLSQAQLGFPSCSIAKTVECRRVRNLVEFSIKIFP